MDTRFDPSEVRNACVLINTADYCQTTAQEVCLAFLFGESYKLTAKSVSAQLEEKLRSKVAPQYKEKISLQAECDLFIRYAFAVIIMYSTS